MKICSVEDCNLKVRARGYCDKHYKRFNRKGNTSLDRDLRPTIYTKEDCDNPHFGLGFCVKHYRQLKRENPIIKSKEIQKTEGLPFKKICSIDGCDRKHQAYGLCKTHLKRQQKYGDPNKLVRAKAGTGYINKMGYRVIHRDGRQILEHRHVMEQVLGRELRNNENVHHINGVKSDNRPENLELWVRSQPTGQRVEDLIGWAKEILTIYGGVI